MLKKVIAVSLCVVFLSVAANASAEDIFATKNGKKYHKADCRLVQNKNPEAISKKEAAEKGLEPCSKCFKDEVSSVKSDAKQQIASTKEKKTRKQ